MINLKDNRELSPTSREQILKQVRKASTICLVEDSTIKAGRSNKCRLSLAPLPKIKTAILNLSKQKDLQLNNEQPVAITEELKTDIQTNNQEATKYSTDIMIGNINTDQTFEKDDDSDLENDEQTEHSINQPVAERLNSLNDTESKPMSLETKLAEDHELEIIGIMNLSSMNLTDNDMPSIIQRAFGDPKTKCIGLILRDNALSSTSVKMLVDVLTTTKTKLKYLSFSNNSHIGDEGVEYLINLLQKNRSITFLALPNTGMTDHGVRLLADTLCKNEPDSPCPPLEKLHISFNKQITDESIEALLQILEQNRTLKVLSVQHCSLSDKARRKLRNAVAKKKKKKFHFSD